MGKKKKTQIAGTISNRRAKFDYALQDNYRLGLVLTGRETKSLRMGHGKLAGAFVSVKEGELWLNNCAIQGMNGVNIDELEQTRPRKLLATKKEIKEMLSAKQQGSQLIPTEILTKSRFIKINVSTAKSKKEYDKRHTIKQRDLVRHA
jgi:SsrA-binding protein